MFVARGDQLWLDDVEYLCTAASAQDAQKAARVLNRALGHPLIERLVGDVVALVYDWIERRAPYAFL